MRDDLAFVILNYKSPMLTKALIAQLNDFGYAQSIFVVDNASPDDSVQQLLKLQGKNIFQLIQNTCNGGYASGNNIGLRAAHQAGYQYALILNTDVAFKAAEDLEVLCATADAHQNAGCIGTRVQEVDGRETAQQILRPSALDMTCSIFAFEAKQKMLSKQAQGTFPIYRAHGCCMLVRLSAMQQVGFLDEKTFLYFEEAILAEKLLQAGFSCICAGAVTVLHMHSVVTKSTLSMMKMLAIYSKSANYYFARYRCLWLPIRWLAVAIRSLSMAKNWM